MGTLIKAICNSCDFTKEFSLGGGMMDQDMKCMVPGINEQDDFMVVDVRKMYSKDITLYNNQKLFEAVLAEGEGIQYMEIFLSPDKNYCPSCKNKNMNFDVFGKFD